MAFLSAGAPDWSIELGAVAGEAIAGIGASHPEIGGLYLRADVIDGQTLVASAGEVAGPERDAAWALTVELSRLWPDWLDKSDVALRVWLPHLVVLAEANLVMDVAEDLIDRETWAAEVVVERGLMG